MIKFNFEKKKKKKCSYYQDEDVRSEDIVFGCNDDGLVTDIVAEMSIDPFGIASSHRVVGGP